MLESDFRVGRPRGGSGLNTERIAFVFAPPAVVLRKSGFLYQLPFQGSAGVPEPKYSIITSDR